MARLFEVLGCAVFDSDQAAKEIYFDPTVKERVSALLGPESYVSDTALNKPYISAKIFGDTALLHALNHIIHPAVTEKFMAFIKAHGGQLIVKESALLLEAGLQGQADKIVVVAAPDELRIQRVMRRDGLSREQIISKMNSQMSQDEKIKRADFVIRNNDKELLIPQVLAIFNVLKPTV